MNADATHRAIHDVFRKEAPRLIASLARIVGDVGRAEELAQDALVGALESWPKAGVPDNARAWLMATAKHRAFDELRRRKRQRAHDAQLDTAHTSAWVEPDEIQDDMLRLVFTACHPVLSAEARVALTLRLLAGLTVEEIARAYVCPEATVAQRIARAKRTLSERRVPYEVPDEGERAARLGSVLEVIYLIFNEGFTATSGESWTRPALCDEALRLARLLVELAPREAEAWGLLALMELHMARALVRVDASGDLVSLLQQERARDGEMLARGHAALTHARALGRGSYVLQAEIAACHADPGDTDWARVASLYEELARVQANPVFELNRAVAVSMVHGPSAALALVDALGDALGDYHLLPAVRGDLLYKLCRFGEARREFERAAQLTRNVREREALTARANECALN